MGARSNIVIQDGEHRVWLYGHWMSCQAIEHAAVGLRSDRYDDPQHLATVVFQSMLRSEGAEGWGYGISAQRYDNQFPILVIDSRSRWRDGGDRGRADVWFEDAEGLHTTAVFSRDEFLAIADTIPPRDRRARAERSNEFVPRSRTADHARARSGVRNPVRRLFEGLREG